MVRVGRMAVVVVWGMASAGRGQVTRVATFENYAEAQHVGLAFTDPLSGISFHDPSTHNNFGIDYSDTIFGGGNYLVSGGVIGGPAGGYSSGFGFIGDLPTTANRISVDVTYLGFGDTTSVVLQALNGAGTVIAQKAGVAHAPDPFTLQVTSGQFDIVRFRLQFYRRRLRPPPTGAFWNKADGWRKGHDTSGNDGGGRGGGGCVGGVGGGYAGGDV